MNKNRITSTKSRDEYNPHVYWGSSIVVNNVNKRHDAYNPRSYWAVALLTTKPRFLSLNGPILGRNWLKNDQKREGVRGSVVNNSVTLVFTGLYSSTALSTLLSTMLQAAPLLGYIRHGVLLTHINRLFLPNSHFFKSLNTQSARLIVMYSYASFLMVRGKV